ncbi:DUF1501 domain-containing protein [Photobacterium angustum]|uniref:DUF1501 domain-containing protein n=1 Tax=Photobacterium angustum TaxID=661 RepID=UPI0005DD256D|nr:DUF1501 domain-containing protein [Photobacterium angustum]KJG34339.1 hypothetical protein UA69_00665 [Photobacterium angustum]PSW91137.1 DUF1501 domain-containing protein [Photobacterium angustum]
MKITRRQFIQSSAALSATSTMSLSGITQAKTQPHDDYKALVVIFLSGGNDAFNMVVPADGSEYEQYISMRPKLGLKAGEMLPLNIKTDNHTPLAIHSSLAELIPLFEQNQATVIVNSGQLLMPTSRSSIKSGEAQLPSFLMAHNFQRMMWQTGAANSQNPLGWAGRLFDILATKTEISPLFAIDKPQRLTTAKVQQQTVISRKGVGDYSGWRDDINVDSYFEHFNQDYTNIFSQHFANTMKSSVSENETLKAILNNHPEPSSYPDTKLGERLKMVSRLIDARSDFGHQRQVFFVSLGGFDTHSNQKETHKALFTELSQAMAAFQTDLNNKNLAPQITTMTMSDFGRRISANSSGTDHGWGGHQLIFGGAIKGMQAYGKWPDLSPGSERDFNNGRMIPEIAADQVNASVCRWMGLNDDQLLSLFPNLANFESPIIDFI